MSGISSPEFTLERLSSQSPTEMLENEKVDTYIPINKPNMKFQLPVKKIDAIEPEFTLERLSSQSPTEMLENGTIRSSSSKLCTKNQHLGEKIDPSSSTFEYILGSKTPTEIFRTSVVSTPILMNMPGVKHDQFIDNDMRYLRAKKPNSSDEDLRKEAEKSWLEYVNSSQV